MNLRKICWIVFAVLVVDQVLKAYIKLSFPLTYYGTDAIVDWGWFRLLFVENKGMAWGARLDNIFPFISENTAKLLLSIFRLLAVTAIGIWLRRAVQQKLPKKQLIAVAFIFAGAVGNIIDSVFYGVLFSDSIGQVATFLPEGGGYAPLWPDWLPFVGGTSFTFFEPVFNVADSAICVGVALLLIQQRKSANR
jgi:signal peptidase II